MSGYKSREDGEEKRKKPESLPLESDSLDLPWPVSENGEPESPAFLTNVSGAEIHFEMAVSLLRACGIPVLRKFPQAGRFVRVITGMTGAGMDLFVPESMLIDAREIISGNADAGEEQDW